MIISEVAWVREQIELTCRGMYQGLEGLATGEARHEIILHRYRQFEIQTRELERLIGPEEATRIACQAYADLVESSGEQHMSGQEIITVNFQAGHLISGVEVFYREKGCTFEECHTEGTNIAYVKMSFPAGTTSRAIEPQGMEYRRMLIFPDGMEVLEVHLRHRGSGPQYSQILRDEENQQR